MELREAARAGMIHSPVVYPRFFGPAKLVYLQGQIRTWVDAESVEIKTLQLVQAGLDDDGNDVWVASVTYRC